MSAMNAHDPFMKAELALVHYGDGEFAVLKPGQYVLCAVSGARIPLETLRYWNPVTQEAYASPTEALIRWRQLNEGQLNEGAPYEGSAADA
jgi:hypothetical protein